MASSDMNTIQDLLRFLSKDAKIPLTLAIGKVQALRDRGLASKSDIASSDVKTLTEIFGPGEEKVAKQALNAAKRGMKKRGPNEDIDKQPARKQKTSYGEPLTGAELERSLELPDSALDVGELGKIALFTNRAPLVLAFAVVLLKYTMPEQPLSSRLSLAQAVVSANSRTKAVSIGLESGRSAEEEGYGEGQPIRKVMGREIRVLTRWGYEWNDESGASLEASQDTQSTLKDDDHEREPALWGLDLEAIKKAQLDGLEGRLSIHPAQNARHYIIKSFDSPPDNTEGGTSGKKKATNASKAAAKEQNLGHLLRALDLLVESWAGTLDKDELDRRAWRWYVRVRPDVEEGVAGWGGKGIVKLSDILDLRRTP